MRSPSAYPCALPRELMQAAAAAAAAAAASAERGRPAPAPPVVREADGKHMARVAPRIAPVASAVASNAAATFPFSPGPAA